jgi:hypothetical protein
MTGRRMLRCVFRATMWSSGRRRVDRKGGTTSTKSKVLELRQKLARSVPRSAPKTFPSFHGGDLLSFQSSWRGPFPIALYVVTVN